MNERIELLTARLRLRRGRRADAPVLFTNYTGDQNCSRFLQRHAHADVAHTQAMLETWCAAAWDDPDAPFSWVISTRDEDEPIGLFVVVPEGHKAEIHFGIGGRFWGRGRAAEAGRAAISALWRSPGTQRIWAVCDVQNTGSRRVLEKLELKCEGRLSKWLVLPAFGDEARDCYIFSSTRRPVDESLRGEPIDRSR